jgi:hypothetical protein
MSYRIAGIDVHKKMLAVVVADVAVEGECQFERRRVATSPAQLRSLAEWLAEREVEEAVMESTAQYWRPVRPHSEVWIKTGSLCLAGDSTESVAAARAR